MKKLGLDPDQMAALLGSRSGLAGISGGSGDLRDLSKAAAAGDQRSQLALDVFTRAIRHYVGAFMLSLGGIDAITFSGGIGENSAEIRSAVLKDLAAFGVQLDEDRNRAIKGCLLYTSLSGHFGPRCHSRLNAGHISRHQHEPLASKSHGQRCV